MKSHRARVSMIAAVLATGAAFAMPAIAGQGAAKEAVHAKPGQSIEASARQRARELNHDSALRGAGQAQQANAELTRGQASVGRMVPAAQQAASGAATGTKAR